MADQECEPFSQEWCDAATKVWSNDVYPLIKDREGYNYTVEFGSTDAPEQVCQLQAKLGMVEWWNPGKKLADADLTFIIWAKREHWKKVAEGTLDPVGAVAAKRVELRKGPMTVVVKEADAFTRLLKGFGTIPTRW